MNKKGAIDEMFSKLIYLVIFIIIAIILFLIIFKGVSFLK